MNLSVIIPFCPDGGRRDQNYLWVAERVRRLLPNAELITSYQEYPPFNRAFLCNEGVKQASRDNILICDADMIFDLDLIENGLSIINDVPWIAPFIYKLDVSWNSSNALLQSDPSIALSNLNLQISRKWGAERCKGGAMLMITKKNYINVGGFDQRFNGWGYEDNAFLMMARNTIGDCVETNNVAYHLYHPLSINQYPNLLQLNFELWKEYCRHYEQEGDLIEWVQNTGHILK